MLQVGHTGTKLVEHPLLVVRLAIETAVAPTENRRPNAAGDEPVDQPGDERRLAGAAGGDIAHTDDRHGGAANGLKTDIEGPVPGGHTEPIGLSQTSQARPRERCRHTAAMVGDQFEECGSVHVREL